MHDGTKSLTANSHFKPDIQINPDIYNTMYKVLDVEMYYRGFTG